MARKTEKVSIGSTQFTITQLGAIEASVLYKKLIDALGPLFRETYEKQKAEGDAETRVFGLILRGLESLPVPLFVELRDAFMNATVFKTTVMTLALPLNTQGCFDDLFAGDMSNMMAWMMACLKQNFAGFLGGAASAAPPAAAAPAPSA